MTIDEFLDALSKTPRKWYLTPFGHIRMCDTYMCPEVALRNGPRGPYSYDNYKIIWAAADNQRGHDPELRARLLQACGLAK